MDAWSICKENTKDYDPNHKVDQTGVRQTRQARRWFVERSIWPLFSGGSFGPSLKNLSDFFIFISSSQQLHEGKMARERWGGGGSGGNITGTTNLYRGQFFLVRKRWLTMKVWKIWAQSCQIFAGDQSANSQSDLWRERKREREWKEKGRRERGEEKEEETSSQACQLYSFPAIEAN